MIKSGLELDPGKNMAINESFQTLRRPFEGIVILY